MPLSIQVRGLHSPDYAIWITEWYPKLLGGIEMFHMGIQWHIYFINRYLVGFSKWAKRLMSKGPHVSEAHYGYTSFHK